MSVTTRGLKETRKAIDSIPAKFGNKFMRSLLRKTGKVVVIPKIANAVHTSKARNNIKVQAVRGEKRAVMVGITSDAYKERWLQLGTEERTTKKGVNTGSIRENNTLAPIFDEMIKPVLNYIMNEGETEIKKMFKNTNKGLDRKISKLG